MIKINKYTQITKIDCEMCDAVFETDTPSNADKRIFWGKAVARLKDMGWIMKISENKLHWETFCEKDRKYA